MRYSASVCPAGGVRYSSEHSVPEKTLDGGPVGGMTVLEPLEYSVREKAPGDGLIREWSIFDLLKHSVL